MLNQYQDHIAAGKIKKNAKIPVTSSGIEERKKIVKIKK
jgi:hypothetical protein